MKLKLVSCFLFLSLAAKAQLDSLNLTNVLVIAQLDKSEDRYTLEINLTELFADCGVKTMASLNVMKRGAQMTTLAEDSIKNIIKSKGIDTYVLVSIRGFDNKFKPATTHQELKAELETGHLFPLYREESTSVSLEFNFYRNGVFVGYDLVKLGGVSSRDDVIKKLRKKMPKRILKYWK